MIGWSALLALGCGLDPQQPPARAPAASAPSPPGSGGWTNRVPSLHVASPPRLTVGQRMILLGRDLVPPGKGKVRVRFVGTFYDASGRAHAVDIEREATQVDGGRVEWTMWPDVVFAPDGREVGRFLGGVYVTNVVSGQQPRTSDPLSLSIEIEPSLVATTLGPVGAGCAPVVGATIEDVELAMAVEAVGVPAASAQAPLRFTWTLPGKYFKVELANSQLEKRLDDAKDFSISYVVESGHGSGLQAGLSGATSALRLGLIRVGEELIGSGRLKSVRTRELREGEHQPVVAHVTMTQVDGHAISLPMRFDVYRVVEVIPRAIDEIARRFAPQQVTDCIPGGDIGRDLSYYEVNSEERHRALTVSWNVDAKLTLAPLGFFSHSQFASFGFVLDATASFGVRVDETVSSSTSRSLDLRSQLLPGQYGVFYRQTTKLRRVADLVGHSVCGRGVYVGEAVLTDWTFTPDFAQGPSCVPPSNLPPPFKADTED